MINIFAKNILKVPFRQNISRFFIQQNDNDKVKAQAQTENDKVKAQARMQTKKFQQNTKQFEEQTKMDQQQIRIYQEQSKVYEQQARANQVIQKNVGMNQFLMRVYNTTGLSIIGALSSSYIFMALPFVSANMETVAMFGAAMMFGGLMGASAIQPTNVVDKIKQVEILKTTNSPLRLGLYGIGVMGLGLSATPLFIMAQQVSPSILPTALGITSAIFGGASLIAYSMPKDKMLGYGGVLGASLCGLIGLQLVGLLASAFIGPNPLSAIFFQANNYLGLVLFSGLVAYDTHIAIKMYQLQNADHLGMSIKFLLDFWNMLIKLISILSKNKRR